MTMQSGRELDVLIDTKVFGRAERWAVFFGGSCYGDGLSKEAAEQLAAKVQGDFKATLINYYDVPSYSTDIRAAWPVVEKMSREFAVTLSCTSQPVRWFCELSRSENVWVNAHGHTPAHAICLAALKAVNVEVSV